MDPAARHEDSHDDDLNENPFQIDFSDAPDFSGAAADEPAWDAGDERRQRDQMAPPREPCECYCLHCRRTFMSDGIWLQRVINAKDGFEGFWMCPTPNCYGKGFTFDIYPTDPNHPANASWDFGDDDDDDDDEAEDEFDDDDDELDDWDDGLDGDEDDPFGDGEYDPDEPQYKAIDEYFGGGDLDDDDIEGEEWKYGLEPGQGVRERAWAEHDVALWESEHERYDDPDERPREVDWSDNSERDGQISDDEDIPF